MAKVKKDKELRVQVDQEAKEKYEGLALREGMTLEEWVVWCLEDRPSRGVVE